MASCPVGVGDGGKAEVSGCGADCVNDQNLCPLLSNERLQEAQDAGLMLDLHVAGDKGEQERIRAGAKLALPVPVTDVRAQCRHPQVPGTSLGQAFLFPVGCDYQQLS